MKFDFFFQLLGTREGVRTERNIFFWPTSWHDLKKRKKKKKEKKN